MAGVTQLLTRLLPLIEKEVREEVCLLLNANNQALTLSQKLQKIVKVLDDAERRLVKDDRILSWLQKLQDIAYEIDDALEDWEMENIKQRFDESQDASNSASSDSWEMKVCSFLHTVCSCFQQTFRRRGIALDIKQMHQRLDSLSQENDDEFKFVPNLGGAYENERREGRETASRVDVSKIHGREDDKKTVMSMLLSESSSEGGDSVKVVSIVGGGGLGKTTLAQLVSNEFKVNKRFGNNIIWVCVSDVFAEIKVAKAILEVIDKVPSDNSQLDPLLEKIEQSILGKKFLLVLDDVWLENAQIWEILKVRLEGGAPGSRVLVTTRKDRVAQILDSASVHPLKPLKDEDSCSILREIAFRNKQKSECVMLEEISWEIAKKCKGLPLTVITIGSLLRFKSSERWKSVLESEMWELKEVRKDIFPLLILSYEELEPAVRRCFSYCAIFPKDTKLNVDELVLVWMAQGFLSSPSHGSDGEMEIVGREYFEDLAMRSFFQDFEKDCWGQIIGCKMHDIVHDFAQFLTKDECLFVPMQQINEEASVVSNQNARHLTVIVKDYNDTLTRIPHCGLEKLRSFLWNPTYPYGRTIDALNLLACLRRVRLLILRDCRLDNIPQEIGNLIHIRYLDISNNRSVEYLPETICNLYHLQTLVIENLSLRGLPEMIEKLVNLRHLLNAGSLFNLMFPRGFEKLTKLRSLTEFSITKELGNKLGWLKDFNQLEGTLRIHIYDDAVDEMEANEANLISKRSIRELRLSCLDTLSLEVIEALQPHPQLQQLELGGPFLPNWIYNLINLKFLQVDGINLNSSMGEFLSHVGKLAFLQRLTIIACNFERVSINLEDESIMFPKLEKLKFDSCDQWMEWEDINEDENTIILPTLQELTLKWCRDLEALPHNLLRKASSLNTLVIIRCDSLLGCDNEIGIDYIPNIVIDSAMLW